MSTTKYSDGKIFSPFIPPHPLLLLILSFLYFPCSSLFQLCCSHAVWVSAENCFV